MAHIKAEDNPSGLRELMANMIFTLNFSDLYWLFLLRLKFAVHLFSEYIKRMSPTLSKVVVTVMIIF